MRATSVCARGAIARAHAAWTETTGRKVGKCYSSKDGMEPPSAFPAFRPSACVRPSVVFPSQGFRYSPGISNSGPTPRHMMFMIHQRSPSHSN